MSFQRLSLAFVCVCLTLSFTAGASTAQAQDSQAVLDRLERLERDIRTLNQQIAQGAAADTGAVAAQPAPAGARGAEVKFLDQEGPSARALVRLDALEIEVRNLTGSAESLSYEIQQLTRRLDQLMVDLDFRLARLEGTNPGSFTQPPAQAKPDTAPPSGSVSKIGAMPPVSPNRAPGAATAGTVAKDGTYMPGKGEVGVLGSVSQSAVENVAPPTDGGDVTGEMAPAPTEPQVAPQVAPAPAAPSSGAASVLPEGGAQERYRFAFDLTRQARYDEAEVAFKAFLNLHGDDDLADNARYWLAETFYVRKRYMEAAQAFFEAYQKAPEGQKAADSLLKLGMTMSALDKSKEACATFGKLRKEFTPLKANIEQTLNREVDRLKCQ